jgi:hypothetical protein
MKASLASDFRPLFVNALASADPQPYVEMLAEVIEQGQNRRADQLEPPSWNWGGTSPAFESWRILFDFVKSCPADELTAGKLDRSLDALERVQSFNCGGASGLYALYVNRGLASRAKLFRDAARKSCPSAYTSISLSTESTGIPMRAFSPRRAYRFRSWPRR